MVARGDQARLCLLQRTSCSESERRELQLTVLYVRARGSLSCGTTVGRERCGYEELRRGRAEASSCQELWP